jgi:hypothetical protein
LFEYFEEKRDIQYGEDGPRDVVALVGDATTELSSKPAVGVGYRITRCRRNVSILEQTGLVACREVTITDFYASKLVWPAATNSCSPQISN